MLTVSGAQVLPGLAETLAAHSGWPVGLRAGLDRRRVREESTSWGRPLLARDELRSLLAAALDGRLELGVLGVQLPTAADLDRAQLAGTDECVGLGAISRNLVKRGG